MMSKRPRVAILGAGKMGAALAEAWAASAEVVLFDVKSDVARRAARRCRGRTASSLAGAVQGARVVLLAVKPQDLDPVLEELRGLSRGASRRVTVSIAAGVTLKHLEAALGSRGSRPRVIRVMPNLAAQVGESMSVCAAGRWATTADRALVRRLLRAVGDVAETPERHLDAVTAVSGSGPAYYFLLTAHLEDAGRALGLPGPLAKRLAERTLIGSGAVIRRGDSDAQALVQAVASKGGTTEAALKVFAARRVRHIVAEAVRAARRRAGELSR